jgi:hypothetical protein
MSKPKRLGEVVRQPGKRSGAGLSIRWLGHYYLTEEGSSTLIEVLVEGPWDLMREFADFRLYQISEDMAESPLPIAPQFILDPTGERLIGSYLDPATLDPTGDRLIGRYLDPITLEIPESEWRHMAQKLRQRYSVRFASFIHTTNNFGPVMTAAGRLDAPEWEPIPERLLRLVWLDV